jgi:pyruvate formate lyase activating enzyme
MCDIYPQVFRSDHRQPMEGISEVELKQHLKESKFYEKLSKKAVKCTLCPRGCVIDESQSGFCKVRQNIEGKLYNLNYGLSTYKVVEPIETNAIFHYHPGTKALALGTIGCNLDCSFCQAWRYTKIDEIHKFNCFTHYSPEDIVKSAQKLNLKVISWTFNDPMAWFEFVLDTAKIAKEKGIESIFKSNHFINEKPLRELAEHVSLFSISIKSIREDFYKKYCKGSLKPVLKTAKILKKLDKHIEICNLVIPTKNNSPKDILDLVNWVKSNLGVETPLHFARFHPDYKMTNIPRTPIEDIKIARKIAEKSGMKYVYSGNVFNDKSLNTYCSNCHNLLIRRHGENSHIVNKHPLFCDNCKTPHTVRFSSRNLRTNKRILKHIWKEDFWSIHLQLNNKSSEHQSVVLVHVFNNRRKRNTLLYKMIDLGPKEKIRYAITRIDTNHIETTLVCEKSVGASIYENPDRAYYSLGQ